MYSTAISVLLASTASFTKSLPTLHLDNSTNITENSSIESRGGITSTYCAYPRTYELTTAPTVMFENPVLITGLVVGPDPAAASITAGYTYSVGFRVTGGISGEGGFSAGRVAASATVRVPLNFGVTWTKGASVSATAYCPPNVACGLTAAAQYLHVEGIETIHICGWGGIIDPDTYPCEYPPNYQCTIANANVPFPFVTDFPVKFDNSLVDGQDSIVTDFNVCAMGYPDDGIPQCPSSAELPPGMTCNIEHCTTASCQAMCANIGVSGPSPTCQWSPSLGCSWCNCRPFS